MDGLRRTVALGLLPLALDVLLPEVGDRGRDLLLRLVLVPEVVVVGVTLGDAWETHILGRCIRHAARGGRTNQGLLSHETPELPRAVDGVPFAEDKFELVRAGDTIHGRACGLTVGENKLWGEVVLNEVGGF